MVTSLLGLPWRVTGSPVKALFYGAVAVLVAQPMSLLVGGGAQVVALPHAVVDMMGLHSWPRP